MSEDNLAPLVTQCPNCTTRFKVTETQLQVATGRVRCGACLTVFDGTDHLLLDGEPLSSGGVEEVDALLDELAGDLDSEDAQAADAAATSNPAEETALKGHAAVEPQSLDLSGEVLPADLTALEEELMADLRGDEVPAGRSEAATGQGEAEWVEDAVDDIWASASSSADAESADTESDAGEIVEPGGSSPASPVNSLQGNKETEKETEEVGETAEQVLLSGVEEPVISITATENTASAASPPSVATAAGEEAPPDGPKPWLTWGLIALAVIGLPAQVLWFQYESWVTDLTFRPVYQLMCDVAGCELPPMRDLALIESRKSVSRRHPDQANVRVVDVLLVNNADFAQPFPQVQISFTSLSGQLVASRRFQPREYLRGDMAKVQLMPPRTPVHVSLELDDPGNDAQSFRVQFH